MRELQVDVFSTVDGYGGGGPRSAPYWGYGAPGLFDWMHALLAEEHVTLMGATTYRLMSEIVANNDDPTFPRMAELPKIVFSKTLEPPLTWANTTVIKRARRDGRTGTEVDGRRAADAHHRQQVPGAQLLPARFVDRVRVMVFPMIHGVTGEDPLFTELPDVDLSLNGTRVIDDRLVLLDYRVRGPISGNPVDL